MNACGTVARLRDAADEVADGVAADVAAAPAADGSHGETDAGADEVAVRFRDVTFVYQVSDGLDGEHTDGRDDEHGDAGNGAPVGERGTDERGDAPPVAGGVYSLDLTIRAGECVVLCGGSGCGKTTVTRLINGLTPHFYPGEITGRVEVCGRDVTEMPLAQTARLVGSVFQNPRSQFFNVDTDSELAFGCENLALERDETVRRVRQAVGAFSLEGLLGRSIFELSGGEKQRIACGCVHAMRPRVYLLDEPSSNLDLASVARLRDALSRLRRQGATIVIAEHRLHYLSGLADRYLYFKDGRVLTEFTPAELERLSVDERLAHGLRCLSLSRAELVEKGRPASRPTVPSASQPASRPAVPPASRPVRDGGVLRVEGLRCSYGRKPVLFIERLDLRQGEVTALIGANGAGKSTLVRCLCGIKPHRGRVSLEGKVLSRRRRLDMSYMVMQDVNHQLFTESVREELLLAGSRAKDAKRDGTRADRRSGAPADGRDGPRTDGQDETSADGQGGPQADGRDGTRADRRSGAPADGRDGPRADGQGETSADGQGGPRADGRDGAPAEGDNEARADRLLARLDLSACAEKHPMALSGGQKQRVAIAAALNAGKRLLFLDEPTSGLDHAGMHRLCELIGDLNEDVFTTVVITHDLELIMGCCTSVLRLEDGAIVEHYLLDENGRNRLLEWGNEMTQRDRQDKTTPRTATPTTAPPEAASAPPTPTTTPAPTPATAPPAPPEAAPEPPPKPPGFGRLLQFALIRKGYSLSSVVLAALAAICGFVPFIAVYLLIAQLAVLYPDFSAADPAALMRYGWLALGGIVANIVLYFAALCLSHIAAFGTLYQLKLDFTSHLAKVPLGFFLQTGTGRLRKIMDDNIEKIEGFIAHQLPDIVAGVTAPVVMLVILFAVDWRFGLASLLGIVIAFAIEMKAYGGGAVQEMAQKYQHTLEEMSNATVEYVRGISVVKAFRQTTYSFTRLRETIRAYTSFVIPYTLNWESPMSAFIVIVNNIYLFVVPLGIIVGMFTPASEMATFVAHFLFYLVFVPCIANVMMKLLYVSTNAVQISSGVAAMDRVLAYPALPEPERPAPVPTSHDIVFEDVRFSYAEDADKAAPAAREADDVEGVREADKTAPAMREADDVEGVRDARGRTATEALKGVSFTARQGEVTALVGPSGSGKTTIAHLICRFFDVDDGRILLGGTDVRALSTERLMEQVSFVFQDVFLFRQSVRDNIRMARLGASDEDVIAAAKAAQCHEFIERLPQGYDTVIGAAGVHLSGGERQRIALARAIIKDAPVVVLDEATAFADPENEHLIQRAFERLMRGKTVVLIAHRLSTVTGADRILVVDGGRIVEQGRHAELLAARGKYAEMWKSYERAVSWTMGQSVAETVAGREHSHA